MRKPNNGIVIIATAIDAMITTTVELTFVFFPIMKTTKFTINMEIVHMTPTRNIIK